VTLENGCPSLRLQEHLCAKSAVNSKVFREEVVITLNSAADFVNFTNTPSFASPTITDIHSAAAAATTFARFTSEIGTPRLVQFNAALRVLARLARLIPG
jgi:hypothetical protein